MLMDIAGRLGMKDLKPIDFKLLFELMKDSHRSDRQLAKALGVSQPTVTRRRAILEEDYIDAFTFLKSRLKEKTGKERDEALKKLNEWYMKQPNVLLVQDGRGMGWDAVCVSMHKNFSDFAEFIRAQDAELSDWVIENQTFHADLKPGINIKPFHLKYLANTNAK